jgi:hypothetical protein
MDKLQEYKFIGDKELLRLITNDSKGYSIKSILDTCIQCPTEISLQPIKLIVWEETTNEFSV